MTIDRPPLLMTHRDLGIGPNISMCVQRCKCHVCIEQQIFLTMNVIDRQTHTKQNNRQRLYTNMDKTKDKRENGT